MVEASLTLLDTQQVDDCWNRIGVHGDKSCERLAEHVHCRNCEVYAAAATYLLDRIALRQDQLDSAETMDSQREQSDLGETRSILVFRLGEEWFGLATGSLVEVAPMNPIHSLPHQRSRALQGVTNVRGALVACLSLGELLDLEPGAAPVSERRVVPRMLIISAAGASVVRRWRKSTASMRFRWRGYCRPTTPTARPRAGTWPACCNGASGASPCSTKALSCKP